MEGKNQEEESNNENEETPKPETDAVAVSANSKVNLQKYITNYATLVPIGLSSPMQSDNSAKKLETDNVWMIPFGRQSAQDCAKDKGCIVQYNKLLPVAVRYDKPADIKSKEKGADLISSKNNSNMLQEKFDNFGKAPTKDNHMNGSDDMKALIDKFDAVNLNKSDIAAKDDPATEDIEIKNLLDKFDSVSINDSGTATKDIEERKIITTATAIATATSPGTTIDWMAGDAPKSAPANIGDITGAETKLVKKKRERCSVCGKRLTLTDIFCRCGTRFCPFHRYSETHKCTYDYKLGRNILPKSDKPKSEDTKAGTCSKF